MLNSKGSKMAAVGVGAAAAAGAYYMMRRRARGTEPPFDLKQDREVQDIADAVVEIEIDEPVVVSGDDLEAAEDLGESWIDELETDTAETGPLPGQQLPISDAYGMEPKHHGKS
jgi:hypothetical protein|nr:hypothetical protein [Kofleriaceae bacterium]